MPVQAMAGEPPQCAPAHPQYQLGYPPQDYSAAGYPASQGYSPAGYPSLLDMQRDGSVTPCSYASTGYLPGSVPVAVTASPMSLTVVQTFRDTPASTQCPFCQSYIVTNIVYSPGHLAWIMCMCLCLTGVCSLGCCLFPLCVEGCQDVIHTCPICRNVLGRYRKV